MLGLLVKEGLHRIMQSLVVERVYSWSFLQKRVPHESLSIVFIGPEQSMAVCEFLCYNGAYSAIFDSGPAIFFQQQANAFICSRLMIATC
jgi:hypothetical protein